MNLHERERLLKLENCRSPSASISTLAGVGRQESQEGRIGQCMSRLRRSFTRRSTRHLDRKELPRFAIDRNPDVAQQMDNFGQSLSFVQAAITMWSYDAEDFWSNVVEAAKSADALLPKRALAERAQAGGSGSRLLGLWTPERVPTLEKILGAELADPFPRQFRPEANLTNLVSTVDLLRLVLLIARPCERMLGCTHWTALRLR